MVNNKNKNFQCHPKSESSNMKKVERVKIHFISKFRLRPKTIFSRRSSLANLHEYQCRLKNLL